MSRQERRSASFDWGSEDAKVLLVFELACS